MARGRRREALALGGLILAATSVLTAFALRVGSFQPDEAYYLELARYIGRHFPSALWQEGIYWHGTQRLDEIILAAPFALLRGPASFAVAHAIQALLFASAALPVWLLARNAGLGPAARLLAATISIAVPWAIVSTSFLAESAAYPAYAWSLYSIHRTVIRPSAGADALAILALTAAALTRTAMLALVPVLPLAIVWQELRCGLGPRPLPGRARALPRALWRKHTLLCALALTASAVALAGLAGLLPNVRASALTGSYYGVPKIGPLGEVLANYRYDVARMAAGTGFVALPLGLAWTLPSLARPRSSASHGLAVICLLGVAAVLLSLVHAGPDERYLLYGAVPIALAFAAALDLRSASRQLPRATAVCALAGTIAVLLVVRSVAWPPPASGYSFFADPAAVAYQRLLLKRTGLLHLPLGAWLLVAAAITIVVIVWLAPARGRRAPRALAFAIAAWALVFCGGTAAYTLQKFTTSAAAAAGGPSAAARSWIDASVPAGARVGVLEVGPGATSNYHSAWRTAEYWNRSIQDQAFLGDLPAWPTPLGHERLPMEVLAPSGLLRADPSGALLPLPRFMLVPRAASTWLGLAVQRRAHDPALDVDLVTLRMPARAAWMITGLSPEGLAERGHPAVATVYEGPLAHGARCAAFFLQASPGAREPWSYRVHGGGRTIADGSIGVGQARRVQVQLSVGRSAHGALARLTIGFSPRRPASRAVLGPELESFAPGACAHAAT